MFAQIMEFDGPRSPEVLAAAERAGRERIEPLLLANPEVMVGALGGFRAVGPDGAEVVVQLARDEATFDAIGKIVMNSELLPGEDPALLQGPDRWRRYEVTQTFGPLADRMEP